MKSIIFNNLSDKPLTKHIENINESHIDIFQLLEIKLDQDFKSPLENYNSYDKIEIDEFNLELPCEQKFSPCDDKKRDLNLENGIWDLESNKFELDLNNDELMRSPKKTLFEEWDSKNIQSPKEKTNNNKMNVDENYDFAKKRGLSSLLERKMADKTELKKQFSDKDNVMNIINNDNFGKNVSIQINNLKCLNIIQSPVMGNNKNSIKKDYVKQRIKDDITTGLNALNERYLNNKEIVKEYKVIIKIKK